MANRRVSLQTVDYVVIILLLLIPLGIGVFFAIKDAKKATRDEYLLGGRDMAILPVTLSLFVTFQSAISVIGVPSETYMYGPTFLLQYFGIAVSFIIACFTMTPVVYPLRITSIFEYLQMRFESRVVRLVSTVLGMLQTFFYLVVALLAPGLALEAAAGIPLWLSVVIVGVIGTIYTAVGGMKSVVWTDAFQTIVLFIGIIGAMITSIIKVGGMGKNWDIAEAGGRTNFQKFNPDFRIRHNLYGAFLIGSTSWMMNLFSQSTCQRISSLRSLKSARTAMVVNAPLNLLYGFICTAMGWCMYSYFFHIRCDPLKAGIVHNQNQITPYYVLHAMQDLPGFAGIYMSSLFSGALSTLSSGINALAANTVEDFLHQPLKSVSEKTATTITKIVVFLYGTAIIIMVYIARNLKGQITQMSISVIGCFGTSVLGMFLLGGTIPWGNKYGAVSGACVSLVFNIWMVIGHKMNGRKLATLAPVSTDQCFSNSTVLNTVSFYTSNGTTPNITSATNVPYSIEKTTTGPSVTSLPESFSVYDISYEWQVVFGLIVCYVVGVIVSRLTRHKCENTPDPKLIIPCLRKVWGLEVPDMEIIHESQEVEKIDYETKNV